MHIKDNILSFSLRDSTEILRDLALRFRDLRVTRGFTRQTLAERAGVSLASLKRFEVTGQISIVSLLKLAEVLEVTEGFDQLFPLPVARTLDEIETSEKARDRSVLRRGRV